MFLIRYPHGLIRRHISTFERILISVFLAGMLFLVINSFQAYPPYWTLVIAVVVFGATMVSPTLGYLIAVAAVAYPLYNLSLYLAALYLAVAILGIKFYVNNLGATLLALAAPWLAPLYLAWIVPVLGGLWWGAAGGAIIGGAAALWGLLIAGMTGLNPDWLMRLSASPLTANLISRFSEANSVETLNQIIEPLAPGPTTLLYFLLQILLWAVVGGITASPIWMPSASLL